MWLFVYFKILTGNTDRNSEVKHVVYGILTRFLRYLLRTSQGGMCMRTEVFGVKKNPSEFEALMYFCMSAFIKLSLVK